MKRLAELNRCLAELCHCLAGLPQRWCFLQQTSWKCGEDRSGEEEDRSVEEDDSLS